jgi:ribosomal protein L31
MKKALTLLLIPIFLIGCSNDGGEATKSVKKQTAVEIHKPNWVINTVVDDFSKKDRTYAELESINEQSVAMLGGATKASIILYKSHPNQSKIYFNKASQPIAESSYGSCIGNCFAQVRFDNGDIQRFRLYEGDVSNNNHGAYIDNKKFTDQVKVARKIQIRIDFFSQGSGDFLFESENPVNWNGR